MNRTPTAANQRGRMLFALKRKNCLTSVYFREVLNVQSPSARISELRKMGYNIQTRRGKTRNEKGILLECAFYHLIVLPTRKL